MRSFVRSSAVLCALAILNCLGISAQMGVPLGGRSDPKLEAVNARELVSKYCRMDYAGTLLNASDWPKIQPTVAWRTPAEFPLFMVTSRFDVANEVDFERGKYVVVVKYRLLGKYDMAEGYSTDLANRIQDVRFTVGEVNGDWRITDVEPNYPHPSKAAAMQWINQKMTQATDPVAKTIYQTSVDRLQGQSGSPLAK